MKSGQYGCVTALLTLFCVQFANATTTLKLTPAPIIAERNFDPPQIGDKRTTSTHPRKGGKPGTLRRNYEKPGQELDRDGYPKPHIRLLK